MKTRPILVLGLILTGIVLMVLSLPATAAPAGQVQSYTTPTPQPNGQIIYIVQPGDNCVKIALLMSISVDYIRQANRLDENCSIVADQQLIVGVGGPVESTPTTGPSPTPTLVEATPTQANTGGAEVCVLLYADMNGDGLRQEIELGIAGGAVSITSDDGSYSQARETVAAIDLDTEEPVRTCFENVPEGDYTVSAAVPEEFNPTTALTFSLEVAPGDTIFIPFGAQARTSPVDEQANPRSPLLGIVGALMLLAGVGLGIYAWRLRK
ncbi:MAG: LysM peptidoglycan-binding domain-containing protein [Chloroflexota bacterium]